MGLGKTGNRNGSTVLNGSSRWKKIQESNFDGLLHSILARVQKRSLEVIGTNVEVAEKYSASRSMRRGATLEAQNFGIPKEVIEANNCWRKQM
jgi:hypothetical protein